MVRILNPWRALTPSPKTNSARVTSLSQLWESIRFMQKHELIKREKWTNRQKQWEFQMSVKSLKYVLQQCTELVHSINVIFAQHIDDVIFAIMAMCFSQWGFQGSIDYWGNNVCVYHMTLFRTQHRKITLFTKNF